MLRTAAVATRTDTAGAAGGALAAFAVGSCFVQPVSHTTPAAANTNFHKFIWHQRLSRQSRISFESAHPANPLRRAKYVAPKRPGSCRKSISQSLAHRTAATDPSLYLPQAPLPAALLAPRRGPETQVAHLRRRKPGEK